MKNYVIINHSDGTAAPASAQDWGAFFQAVGGSLVDGGKPFTKEKAVLKAGEIDSSLSDTVAAYYIIKAESLEEAVALTKGSPLADKPGCEVRIYETAQM